MIDSTELSEPKLLSMDFMNCRRLCANQVRVSLLNRVTEKGEAYDEAMELLHCLGLREKIAERGAKLGDAIRVHLQNHYRIEQLTSDEKDVIDASSDEQSMMET